MNIIQSYLPKECYSRNSMKRISGIVVHYISAVNVLPDDPFNQAAIRQIFIDNGVSAHYQITRDAKVLELVPLPLKAYHAGRSIMNGMERCNSFTVGIEIEGGKDFEFLPDQMALFKHLSANLMTKHHIPFGHIQGHDEVRAAWKERYPTLESAKENYPRIKRYPGDKVDPGERFPWDDVIESLKGVTI